MRKTLLTLLAAATTSCGAPEPPYREALTLAEKMPLHEGYISDGEVRAVKIMIDDTQYGLAMNADTDEYVVTARPADSRAVEVWARCDSRGRPWHGLDPAGEYVFPDSFSHEERFTRTCQDIPKIIHDYLLERQALQPSPALNRDSPLTPHGL